MSAIKPGRDLLATSGVALSASLTRRTNILRCATVRRGVSMRSLGRRDSLIRATTAVWMRSSNTADARRYSPETRVSQPQMGPRKVARTHLDHRRRPGLLWRGVTKGTCLQLQRSPRLAWLGLDRRPWSHGQRASWLQLPRPRYHGPRPRPRPPHRPRPRPHFLRLLPHPLRGPAAPHEDRHRRRRRLNRRGFCRRSRAQHLQSPRDQVTEMSGRCVSGSSGEHAGALLPLYRHWPLRRRRTRPLVGGASSRACLRALIFLTPPPPRAHGRPPFTLVSIVGDRKLSWWALTPYRTQQNLFLVSVKVRGLM